MLVVLNTLFLTIVLIVVANVWTDLLFIDCWENTLWFNFYTITTVLFFAAWANNFFVPAIIVGVIYLGPPFFFAIGSIITVDPLPERSDTQ